MWPLSSVQRYYFYRHATDMRKSFNGLSGLVRNELGGDPLSGDFLFSKREIIRNESGLFQRYQYF